MSESDALAILLSYAPLGSLPVMYVWFGLVNRTWLAPTHFSFGLPLAAISFGSILIATVKVAAVVRGIGDVRLIVCLMADLIWVVLILVQAYIRRTYQDADPAAVWLWLVGVSNGVGLATYFLLTRLLHKVGL